MSVLTSVLGSLPRSDEVLSQFESYEAVYQEPSSLEVLRAEAKTLIREQEALGLDIVNDGEVQRSGYFSVFYDSFDGYLPTAIGEPTILDDGHYWNHHSAERYKIWNRPRRWGEKPAWFKYGAVIVDKLAPKGGDSANSVFHREASVMTAIASQQVKITLPSPYQIMRRSWHPIFSRDAYPTQEEYLDDIVRHYIPIIKACERLGVDVIQFDDDRITLLLDPKLRRFLDLEREIDLCASSLNKLFAHMNSTDSAVHICRAIIHKEIPWTEARFLERMLKKLQCDQFSVAINDTSKDLLPFEHFPAGAHLLFGVIYTDDYALETQETMFRRLKDVLEYVPLERVILTSNCGFSPYARVSRGLTLVWNKLRNLVKFSETINEFGLSDNAIKQADQDSAELKESHQRILRSVQN